MKLKPRSARRRTSRRTELRRAPERAMRRVAKDAAQRTQKDEATASLEGMALVTGVLSLFAFTLAAAFVGVALLVASSWGESPRDALERRPLYRRAPLPNGPRERVAPAHSLGDAHYAFSLRTRSCGNPYRPFWK